MSSQCSRLTTHFTSNIAISKKMAGKYYVIGRLPIFDVTMWIGIDSFSDFFIHNSFRPCVWNMGKKWMKITRTSASFETTSTHFILFFTQCEMCGIILKSASSTALFTSPSSTIRTCLSFTDIAYSLPSSSKTSLTNVQIFSIRRMCNEIT